MATINAVNTNLSGQSGTGSFAGTNQPTLTSPLINQINDTNNAAAVAIIATATAVNYLALANSAMGNPVEIVPVGSDTNIQMNLQTKGVGQLLLLSANTTSPVAIYSGTGYQHGTQFIMSNTSALRNVTFQDADGTLAYLADRGWVLIQAQSPSGVATVEFTNITGYTNYMFVYSGFTPVTNGASFIAQVSINNGSSYLTSAGDYYLTAITNTAGTLVGGTSLVQANIVASVGCINTVPNASGHLLIMNMGSAQRHAYECNNVCFNTSVQLCTTQGLGFIPSTNALNAVRFLFTSGNISAGQISLYGMK